MRITGEVLRLESKLWHSRRQSAAGPRVDVRRDTEKDFMLRRGTVGQEIPAITVQACLDGVCYSSSIIYNLQYIS